MAVDDQARQELDAAQAKRNQMRHNALQEHGARIKQSQVKYREDCEDADKRYRLTRDAVIVQWKKRVGDDSDKQLASDTGE